LQNQIRNPGFQREREERESASPKVWPATDNASGQDGWHQWPTGYAMKTKAVEELAEWSAPREEEGLNSSTPPLCVTTISSNITAPVINQPESTTTV